MVQLQAATAGAAQRPVSLESVPDSTKAEFRVSFVWRVGFAIAGIFANFALGVVAARSLEKREVASYYVLVTALMIGPSLARMGLGAKAVQQIGALRGSGDPNEARSFARATLTKSALSTIVVSGVLGALVVARPGDEHYVVLSLLASGLLACEAIRLTIADVFAGFGRARWSAAMTHSVRAILSALIVGALMLAGVDLTLGVVFGAVAAASAGLVLAGWWRVRPDIRCDRTSAHRARLPLAAGAAFLVAELVGLIIGRGDIWIAAWSLDAKQAALYGAASVIAMQLGTPVGLANMALAPVIAAEWHAGRRRQVEDLVRSILTLATLAMVPIVVVIVLWGGDLLSWLYGAEFGAAGDELAVLAVGNAALFVFGAANAVLLMTGGARVAAVMLSLWLLAIGAIALGATQWYGSMGLATASAVATVGLYGLQTVACKKVSGVRVWPTLSVRAAVNELRVGMRRSELERA